MAGGLMQLVAIGVQDIYLSGNPQFTYFKSVYKRHTNFSIESIEQVYNGEADFGKKFTITIGRNGDLLGNITLEVDLGLNTTGLFDDLDNVGEYKWIVKDNDFRGWLKCDGRFVNKHLYPKLFHKINYSFGSHPTDINLFKLPDLRGRVPGGINDGSGSNIEYVDASGVSEVTDSFTIENIPSRWLTGTAVKLFSTASLPFGLNSTDTFYIIRYSDTQVQFATSYLNAINGSQIDLIDYGTGVHFIKDIFYTNNLGLETGQESHSLLINELPSHTHIVDSDGLHNHTGTTSEEGSHYHNYYDSFAATNISGASQNTLLGNNTNIGTYSYEWRDSEGNYSSTPQNIPTDYNGLHSHNLNVNDSGTHSHNLQNTGNNNLINNVQPTSYIGNMFIYSGDNEPILKANEYLKDNIIRWGFQLIDYVEIEIGGQLIDRHYGEWLDIWTQISYSRDKYEQLLTMINTSLFSSNQQPSLFSKVAKVYIPMQFWFNRNPGLYLPLIALQYHDVKLNIVFNTKNVVNTATRLTSNIIKITNFNYNTASYDKNVYIDKIIDLRVFADYVFLDTDERRRFAQSNHEYLIELVQSSGIMNILNQSVEIPLYFSHPIKTIIWRAQRRDVTFQDDSTSIYPYNSKYFLSNLYDFSTIGGNTSDDYSEYYLNSDTINSVKLQLNSVDRFKERDGSYFRVLQPNLYTSSTANGLSFYHNSYRRYGGGFYMYNFGLTTDLYQPSGTCNFSRIDNAILYLRMNPYATNITNANLSYNYYFRIYAISYNVLRIMSGMAGLAYSN